MPMANPCHPGEVVKYECLEALGLTITEAAKGLRVTRQALSSVLNGKSRVSVDMAIRFSKAFGSTPDTWLRMQIAYDLWHARDRAKHIKVKRFKEPSAV